MWDDTLVSTKDGVYDLFTLTRAAKFIDEDHGQTLQGDVLKVWLDPAGDKPAAALPQRHSPKANGAAAAPPGSVWQRPGPFERDEHSRNEPIGRVVQRRARAAGDFARAARGRHATGNGQSPRQPLP